MQNLARVFAVAAGLIIVASQASAQDGGVAGASATACPVDSNAADTGTVSASGGSGSDTHNLKVFACNGVRVGTAISTTKTAEGSVLTIMPDANFVNGVANFQISATGATTDEEGITLAMTDRAVREYLAKQ